MEDVAQTAEGTILQVRKRGQPQLLAEDRVCLPRCLEKCRNCHHTSSLAAESSGVTRPLVRGSLANYEGVGKPPASTFRSNACIAWSGDSERAAPAARSKAHRELLGKYLNRFSI